MAEITEDRVRKIVREELATDSTDRPHRWIDQPGYDPMGYTDLKRLKGWQKIFEKQGYDRENASLMARECADVPPPVETGDED